MLRLTKKADYGLQLLGELALDPAGQGLAARPAAAPRSARELARQVGLPRALTANLLKALARGGLVRAARGAGGGYALSRPAAAISLRDVLVAVDGPPRLTDCAGPAPSAAEAACRPRVRSGARRRGCRAPCDCRARGLIRRVQVELDRLLAGVTVAELLAPPTPPAGSSKK